MQRFLASCLFLAIAVSFTGCEPAGPSTVKVAGSASFDGKPIGEGDIVFKDAGGATASQAGKIQGGLYEIDATPGEKVVEIYATRILPGEINTDNPGSSDPNIEMYIPAKYNSATTLKQTVPADGGTIDFALEK